MARLVNDADLQSFQPSQLSDYLLSRGWTLHEEYGDKATIWDSPDGVKDVWVPRSSNLRDYKKLVIEALSVLSDVEERSANAILQDLSLSWADVARFRVETGALGTSTLPLSDGVMLVKTARDVILSGARWLVEPRAAYYSRPLGPVSQFLRSLQMGQTEVGSYIVTVISPLSGTETAPDFARQSMKQVLNAIAAVKTAAIQAYEQGDITFYDDAVSRGVSANLCDALFGLAGTSPTSSVETRFAWSDRLFPGQERPASVTLDSRLVQTLRPAAERLREREPEPDITIRGSVQTLTDSTEVQHQSDATIAGEIDGKLRRIRFTVSGADRQRTIDGFEQRLPIIVRGTLDRTGMPYRFIDVRTVTLIAENEDVPNIDPNALLFE